MKNTVFVAIVAIILSFFIANIIEINKEREVFMEFYEKNKNIDLAFQYLNDKLDNVILNLME